MTFMMVRPLYGTQLGAHSVASTTRPRPSRDEAKHGRAAALAAA
jgi:hypothetical protein